MSWQKPVAEALVAGHPEIGEVHCLMVSKIGAPVSDPALVHVKLATHGGVTPDQLRGQTEEVVADHLTHIPELIEQLTAGKVRMF